MFLFVGLGNIGDEYNDTRHNVGFIIVDKLIREYNFNCQGKKFHSEIFFGTIDCEKGIIIKPQTYMNRSGVAVSEISRFYKIPLENIYVFHDDMDLDFGNLTGNEKYAEWHKMVHDYSYQNFHDKKKHEITNIDKIIVTNLILIKLSKYLLI